MDRNKKPNRRLVLKLGVASLGVGYMVQVANALVKQDQQDRQFPIASQVYDFSTIVQVASVMAGTAIVDGARVQHSLNWVTNKVFGTHLQTQSPSQSDPKGSFSPLLAGAIIAALPATTSRNSLEQPTFQP